MRGCSTGVWDKRWRSENRDNIGPFKCIQNIYSAFYWKSLSVWLYSEMQQTDKQCSQFRVQHNGQLFTKQRSFLAVFCPPSFRSRLLVPILLCCKESWIKICAATWNCFQNFESSKQYLTVIAHQWRQKCYCSCLCAGNSAAVITGSSRCWKCPWQPCQTGRLWFTPQWRRWRTWTYCTNIWSTDSTASPSTAWRRWWKETPSSCKATFLCVCVCLYVQGQRCHLPLVCNLPLVSSVHQVGTTRRRSPYSTRTSRR